MAGLLQSSEEREINDLLRRALRMGVNFDLLVSSRTLASLQVDFATAGIPVPERSISINELLTLLLDYQVPVWNYFTKFPLEQALRVEEIDGKRQTLIRGRRSTPEYVSSRPPVLYRKASAPSPNYLTPPSLQGTPLTPSSPGSPLTPNSPFQPSLQTYLEYEYQT